GFFARQDTRTPVRTGIIARVANMVFYIILVWHYRHVWLALATSASAWLNTGLLRRGLRRLVVYQPSALWRFLLPRLLFAVILMTAVIYWVATQTQVWFEGAAYERGFMLMLLVVAGGATYLGVLLASGVRLQHLRR